MAISRKLMARQLRQGNGPETRSSRMFGSRRHRGLPPSEEVTVPEELSDTIARLCNDDNYEEALKILGSWEQKDPENLDVILSIISIRGRLGRYDKELIDTLSKVIDIAFTRQSDAEPNPIVGTDFARRENIYLFDLLVQRGTILQELYIELELANKDLRIATELDLERMERLRTAMNPMQELELCFAQLEIDGEISITEENVSYLEKAIEILRGALDYRNDLKMRQLLLGMLKQLIAYYKATNRINDAVEKQLIFLEYDPTRLNVILEIDTLTRDIPELLTTLQINVQDLYLNAMTSSAHARVAMLAGLLNISEDIFIGVTEFFNANPSREQVFEKIGELSALLQTLADEENWLESINIYKQIMLYHPTFGIDLYSSGSALSASIDNLRKQYDDDASWQTAFALAVQSEEAQDYESANLYYETIAGTLNLLEDSSVDSSGFTMI
ncbi:MAG: hypothetical protein JXR42_02590 [Gammaproteobacteria bacterium]|nr:hypothetical protein [Gammaproteobacteria bacterium]